MKRLKIQEGVNAQGSDDDLAQEAEKNIIL